MTFLQFMELVPSISILLLAITTILIQLNQNREYKRVSQLEDTVAELQKTIKELKNETNE